MLVVTGTMVSELSSLSVLQNERKREVNLESISLVVKDHLNGLCNGFCERSMIIV